MIRRAQLILPTFLMIKSAPLNCASNQRFLQSVIGFFIMFKCTTLAVNIFYNLSFSSLLSINALHEVHEVHYTKSEVNVSYNLLSASLI